MPTGSGSSPKRLTAFLLPAPTPTNTSRTIRVRNCCTTSPGWALRTKRPATSSAASSFWRCARGGGEGGAWGRRHGAALPEQKHPAEQHQVLDRQDRLVAVGPRIGDHDGGQVRGDERANRQQQVARDASAP